MGDEIKKDEEIEPDPEESADDLEPEGEDKDDLETESAAEPDPASTESDDPADVPYARFKEVYDKAKSADEYETKLDQFKRLGDEAYYRLYPDEKPEEAEKPSDGLDVDIGSLVVQGGPYDGKTINEVLEADQPTGTKMLVEYYREQERAVDEEKTRKERLQSESETEVKEFSKTVSQELFEKTEGITEEEAEKVNAVVNDTLKWMNKTNRGGGILTDAYLLMNHESSLKKAKGDTLKGVVDELKKGGTPYISSTNTPSKESGYARFLSMDAKQAASEMEKLNDAEQMEFLKKAPSEVRKRFPQLPWDD